MSSQRPETTSAAATGGPAATSATVVDAKGVRARVLRGRHLRVGHHDSRQVPPVQARRHEAAAAAEQRGRPDSARLQSDPSEKNPNQEGPQEGVYDDGLLRRATATDRTPTILLQ